MRKKPKVSHHHPLCFEGLEIFSFPASKFICQPRFAGFGAIWLGLPYKSPHFIGENQGIPTKITPNWIPTTKSRTKHFRHVMWTSSPEESLPCSQPWKCIDESFAVLAFTMWIFLVSASEQTKKPSKKTSKFDELCIKKNGQSRSSKISRWRVWNAVKELISGPTNSTQKVIYQVSGNRKHQSSQSNFQDTYGNKLSASDMFRK